MKLWSSPTVGIIRTSIHHPENHWTLLWRGLTLHTKVLGSPNHHFWDPMILRASNFHSLSLNKFNQNIRWSLVERFTFTTLHWTDVKQVIYQIGRTSFFCEMSSELKTTCWISLNFVDEQKTIELEIWDVGPVPFLKTLLKHIGTLRSANMTIGHWAHHRVLREWSRLCQLPVVEVGTSQEIIVEGTFFQKFPSWWFQIQAKWKHIHKSNWFGSQITRGGKKKLPPS